MKILTLRVSGWLLACAGALLVAAPGWAAPQRDVNARGGDCVACHGSEAVMPARHKPTAAMKLADCLGCHEKGSEDSLVGKLNGSHMHRLAGVGCADCHGKAAAPQPLEMAQCLSCHGSGAKVAAQTAKVKPRNPHHSPHYDNDLDCSVCHYQHEKSVDYCADCHRFGFKVP